MFDGGSFERKQTVSNVKRPYTAGAAKPQILHAEVGARASPEIFCN